MPSIHLLSQPISDAERGALIFDGDLIVFKNVPPLAELCTVTDELIRTALRTSQPRHYPAGQERDEAAANNLELRRRFRSDPHVPRLTRQTLEHVGVDASRTYWDQFHLRVATAAEIPPDSGHIGVHRDTWSSNVYAQTNWWTPIYSVSAHSTIALYPSYWSVPVPNTSAQWDLEEIREQRRALRSRAGVDVQLVPEPTATIDRHGELRMALEAGDLLCFSGAHLHASVPNTSGLTRFSMEMRTVCVDDMRAGRAAPNVDGAAPRVATSWFRSLTDGSRLSEAPAMSSPGR
jgi:hypothetical protein